MINFDIEVKTKKWLALKDCEHFVEQTLNKIIKQTLLKKYFKKNNFLQINISLVSDAQIKKINLRYRKKNKSTNVLSFANLDEKQINAVGLEKVIDKLSNLVLGDIVLAFEIIKKESILQNKNFHDHLSHLLAHALLHLLGYDHESDKQGEEMEKLEIKILKNLGISNPYKAK
ncbi:MAG: rRNA maturation RNase YbeY [Alphaproteobacteria bacterium]